MSKNNSINTIAVISATSAENGFFRVDGGVIPRIKSLRIPPPTAVMSAKTIFPNTSIFLSIPTITPDIAKATVPINAKEIFDVAKKLNPETEVGDISTNKNQNFIKLV